MISRKTLEKVYRRYNRRKYVHPDPLEFLYNYPEIEDREIAGLIASSLAYGRVTQILVSASKVLGAMGDSPRDFITDSSRRLRSKLFCDFCHRFASGNNLLDLLDDVRAILREYGSLNECFTAGIRKSDKTVLPALNVFLSRFSCAGNHLIPGPGGNSPCKRMNLFLRWMVRKDKVDPGGWKGVSKNMLIVPLDTHMARIGRKLKLTRLKSPGLRMAVEITNSFRKITPEDPVKYDFAITRFGIRGDMTESMSELGLKS